MQEVKEENTGENTITPRKTNINYIDNIGIHRLFKKINIFQTRQLSFFFKRRHRPLFVSRSALQVTGSMVAFAKLQGLVGGNASIPGGNVRDPAGQWRVDWFLGGFWLVDWLFWLVSELVG